MSLRDSFCLLLLHDCTLELIFPRRSLPNDVSLAVFAVGARTEEGWNFLFEKYRETLYTSLKSRIKSALSITPLAHKLKW